MEDLKKMSFGDLYSAYMFVLKDSNRSYHDKKMKDLKILFRDKQKEIEKELYNRLYGYDPYDIKEE